MDAHSPKTLVTVGASDSAGADGIAADLRTFAAMGVHGTAVVTGVVAGRGVDANVIAPYRPTKSSGNLSRPSMPPAQRS